MTTRPRPLRLSGRSTQTSIARWVSIVGHPLVTTLVLAAAVELGWGAAGAARTVIAVAVLFVLPLALLTALAPGRHQWAEVAAGLAPGAVTGTVVAHLR